jgi:uncharacterized protein YkwD
MRKNTASLAWTALLLGACISISVEPVPTRTPAFATSALIPTRAAFLADTLRPLTQAPPAAAEGLSTPERCTDRAILLRDVTIPDDTRMTAGESFIKTWEFQNSGTCPWTDYTLDFAGGERMGAPASAPIPQTLAGGMVQVSVELTAPEADGSYTALFTLNDPAGQPLRIGTESRFWAKITVGETQPITSQPSPSGWTPTPYVPKGGNSGCNYSRNAAYVQELITSINQARANAGLPLLAVDPQLTDAAQAHSADMACNNFLGHTGSDGSWIGDRLVRAGYPADTYYVEIIAVGTPQNALDQWKADPPHWEAVLDPLASEFGAGYAYYADSDFGGYITVDFGVR